MTIVKTLAKGQVVIPKLIRDRLGIKVGSRLWLQVKDGRVILKPLPADPIEALCGILKQSGPSTAELLKWRREERAREEREIA
jgi:AbrB family looped-hinge helix DNA binding protein